MKRITEEMARKLVNAWYPCENDVGKEMIEVWKKAGLIEKTALEKARELREENNCDAPRDFYWPYTKAEKVMDYYEQAIKELKGE